MQTIKQLDAIASQFPDHVILTYRPTDDQPIAVAAWGHLLTLNSVEDTDILDFIERYINKGPKVSESAVRQNSRRLARSFPYRSIR